MSDLDKRAAIALSEWLHQTASPGLELAVLPHANEIVAVVFAALGLDDLDAAVTRLAMAAVVPFHHAEAGLLAALTPPDTSSP